jgi:hypothetical protein
MNRTNLARSFLIAALMPVVAPVNAVEVLFAFVQDDDSWVADGVELAGFIDALPGVNVTQRVLDNAVYADYNTFDQIWVYDLERGANNNANQAANYTGIATWYNDRAAEDQNLIVDGRIVSSASFWTTANGMSSEEEWIQNYAIQLDSLGGGLVLGTDHADVGQPSGQFVDGINEINAQILIDPFSSFFGSFPTSQALVDVNSPLFIAGLDACRVSPTDPCINDNSTTSFAPAGLQPNGTTLTPVAYHGTVSSAFDNAAVASTMGSITFGTCGGPDQPPCKSTSVPEPTTLLLLSLGLAGLGFARRRNLH